MGAPKHPPEFLDRIFAHIADHGPDRRAVAHAMGLTYPQLDNILNRQRARFAAAKAAHASRKAAPGVMGPDAPPAPAPTDGQVVTDEQGATATVEAVRAPRITTLAQLLETGAVDLAVWEVERHVVNKWEVASAQRGTDGRVAFVTEPLYQVKAWLKRKPDESWRAALLADLAAERAQRGAQAPLVRRAIPREERHLLEVCLMDLHIGKLAWGAETGHDYDARIAEGLARHAVEDLLAQAAPYALDRILLPLGNDYFHVDNLLGTTTAGTPQDRDSRFHKMFRVGRALASWMIETCAQVAPVSVVVVPGNHDRLATFQLGEVLAAEFAHDARVTIDNTPTPRKYQRYGANLIGFAHGDSEPHDKLPLIMATEQPQAWSETRFREWHLGHLHTSRRRDALSVNSTNGVRTRILQSLSGVDSWHAARGYVGEPGGAEAFVWKFTGGLRANLFTHPAPGAYSDAA